MECNNLFAAPHVQGLCGQKEIDAGIDPHCNQDIVTLHGVSSFLLPSRLPPPFLPSFSSARRS